MKTQQRIKDKHYRTDLFNHKARGNDHVVGGINCFLHSPQQIIGHFSKKTSNSELWIFSVMGCSSDGGYVRSTDSIVVMLFLAKVSMTVAGSKI